MNYDETREELIEVDQLIESIRLWSHDLNDIKFFMDRNEAVEKVLSYLRKNYTRKKPDAFVSVSATA